MEKMEIIKQKEWLQEKEEQGKEIQRIELDLDKGIDIVIKTNPGAKLDRRLELIPGAGIIFNTNLDHRIGLPLESASIVLEDKEKVIANFQKEVPSNYKFVFTTEEKRGTWFYTEGKDLSAIIMPKDWDNSKDILSLLHEIGHSLQNHQEENMINEKLEDTKKKIWKLGETTYSGLRGEETKNQIQNLREQFKRLREKSLRMQAQEERDAWAKALRITRKFKKRGIDLLKPFRGDTSRETRDNIENFIHNSLYGYEEGLKEDISGYELNEDLKGIFTKRYKEKRRIGLREVSKEVAEEALKI